jgi:hypothetical protein
MDDLLSNAISFNFCHTDIGYDYGLIDVSALIQ